MFYDDMQGGKSDLFNAERCPVSSGPLGTLIDWNGEGLGRNFCKAPYFIMRAASMYAIHCLAPREQPRKRVIVFVYQRTADK